MHKIGVIGGRETVMGFKALGLEISPVDSVDEARQALRRLAKPEEAYAILYVEETFARDMAADIDKYKDLPTPAIILIPGREGSLGLGQSALQAAVERAVGTNIM